MDHVPGLLLLPRGVDLSQAFCSHLAVRTQLMGKVRIERIFFQDFRSCFGGWTLLQAFASPLVVRTQLMGLGGNEPTCR